MSAADLPRYILGAFFLVLGIAGAIYFFTFEDTRTATAVGTVVRVAEYSGRNHSRTECPVFAWTANGRAVEEESNHCDRDSPYTIGEEVAIRFDPVAPDDVVPDSPDSSHPLFPLIPGMALCFAVAAFFLWPKRRQ